MYPLLCMILQAKDTYECRCLLCILVLFFGLVQQGRSKAKKMLKNGLHPRHESYMQGKHGYLYKR